MTVTIRSWYGQRSAREQRLLLLMLAVALPVLVWLLVIQPVGRAYDAALDRHLAAVDRNGRVRALAAAPRTAAAPGAGQDLGALVTESAARSGLTLGANTSAGSGAVAVAIPTAPSVAAINWLRELELAGVRVEELRLVPAADGQVSLTARLAR